MLSDDQLNRIMGNLPSDPEQGAINIPDMKFSSVLTLNNKIKKFAIPSRMP